MVQYKRPGVYVREQLSNPSITAVPTSIAVFIGLSETGTQGEAVMVDSWDAYTRAFGGFMWFRYLPFAVYAFFTEGGSKCYVINAPPDPGSPTPAAKAQVQIGPITFTAASTGVWGKALAIRIANDAPGSSAGGSGTQTTPTFLIQVLVPIPKKPSKETPTTPELMLKAYIEMNGIKSVSLGKKGDQYYVLETHNGFSEADLTAKTGAVPALEGKINGASFFIRATVKSTSSSGKSSGASKTRTVPANGISPLTGGADGNWDFSSSTMITEVEKIEGYSLLAVPDTIVQGKTSDQMEVINEWLLAAQNKMSFFVVADPPYGQTPSEVTGYKEGSAGGNALNSSYGALYYPWLWFVNPLSGTKTLMPPSGATLGRYAYSDDTVGVWKAPAGTIDGALQMVTEVAHKVTDSDQDTLNPAGVNAIRAMVNYGILIWGARTLSTESQWIYVNVRRLFIFIEQSIQQSLKWVVFEPNTPKLWDLVTRDISGFLKELWHEGALFGETASDAFFVTCNASNNPPEQINQGILTVNVGLAAVRPAEFVVLVFSQKTLTTGSGS